MEELNCLQCLDRYFTHLVDFEAFVAVVFNKVVQTLSQWLEYQTHVACLAVALSRLIGECLL
jgi:hypothetical protein